MSSDAQLSVCFAEGVTIATTEENDVELTAPNVHHRFQRPAAATVAVLERLANHGASDDELSELAGARDSEAAFLSHLQLMFQLSAAGVLRYVLRERGIILAEFRWLARGRPLDDSAVSAGENYTLSRFAYLRKEAQHLVVECPLGSAQVRLLDPRSVRAVGVLAQPASHKSLARDIDDLSADAAHGILNLLANASALVRASAEGDEQSPPVGWWEFHDLLFHARTRLGRHNYPYGGTFVRKGIAPPPPLLKPDTASERIPLYVPDLQRLAKKDEPFSSVLERRRSVRDYDESPITANELGEFLYRSARIQSVIATSPSDMDYSYRPHPGGGAIHELEIYPVIALCEGLARGLYHYNPAEHSLSLVSKPTPAVERLLEVAWITADRKSKPQVYFAITARFARLQWKYESVVYAIILKNVGALYQTMYLVGTAIGLAPCALGGGDSDLFALAAGLDYYNETTVGDFMLGSRKK